MILQRQLAVIKGWYIVMLYVTYIYIMETIQDKHGILFSHSNITYVFYPILIPSTTSIDHMFLSNKQDEGIQLNFQKL